MARAVLHFDESRFPLVVLTMKGAADERDYEEMFQRIERIMQRGKPYLMISDLREVSKVADAKQRQRIAEWARVMEEKHGDLGLCSIMVIRSAIVRGSLTALQWLTGKKKKDIWVADMEEALQVASKIAAENGIRLPTAHTA